MHKSDRFSNLCWRPLKDCWFSWLVQGLSNFIALISRRNKSFCRKTFSSIFQVKVSLNPLPDRGLGLSMYLRFRIENVLIFGTQIQVLPIIPKKLEQVFLRFIWLFLFPSLLIIKEGKCSLKRTQDYILTY